jgi:hypothetical protein
MIDAEIDTLLTERMASQPHLFTGSHVERDSPIDETTLRTIESSRDVVLPREFKRFLATHGAGSFAFADIYSPDESSDWSLWTEYDFMPDLRGKFLPFANNGCGDYYGFAIVDGVCADAVSWADHETNYSIIPSNYSDFNEFLALVALNA